jgi:uncharacterized protein YyaL (SSP411 family)
MASSCLRWLLAPGVSESRGFYIGGLILAADEVASDPLHVAVIGSKADPVARSLYTIALGAATSHKLVEWWDRREGPAPRGEDIYPDLPRAAAYVCANGACSNPMFTPEALATRLAKLQAAGR